MSSDLVMERGHTVIKTVDAIARLAGGLHEQPDNKRYRFLVERVPSAAMMLGLIRILEGISEHFEGELSVEELLEIGTEHSNDMATREVAAYLDMVDRGLEPDDPFGPLCK